MISSLTAFTQPWMVLLADDPFLGTLQLLLVFVGFLLIFLVFFTTKDVLLRTHSFWAMFGSIVLVAVLPGFGFFLYLLFRPSRTLREREVEEMVRELHAHIAKHKKAK